MPEPAGFGYAAASAERRGNIVVGNGIIANKGSRS